LVEFPFEPGYQTASGTEVTETPKRSSSHRAIGEAIRAAFSAAPKHHGSDIPIGPSL
jgi:hypothetical protein